MPRTYTNDIDPGFEYTVGQMYGCGQGAWGYIGNQERQRRQQSEQELSRSRRSVGGRSLAARQPRAPGPSALFADAGVAWISKTTAAAFAWVPRSVRLLLKASLACVALGFVLGEGGGPLLAAAAAGGGWLAPRILLGTLRVALWIVLALMHFAWMLTFAALVLGCLAALGYALFVCLGA